MSAHSTPSINTTAPGMVQQAMAALHGSRDLLRFVGGALLTGVMASATLMAVTLLLSGNARAEPLYAHSLTMQPGADAMLSRSLWRYDDPEGRYLMPLLETEMIGQPDGVIGRVKMVQTFKNPMGFDDDAVVEIEYRHPLPYGQGAFAVTVSSSPITVRLSASSKL